VTADLAFEAPQMRRVSAEVAFQALLGIPATCLRSCQGRRAAFHKPRAECRQVSGN